MQRDHSKHYDAAEQDTGLKWVGDGVTPIYRKTVSFGALPNATTKTVVHGLTAGVASGNMDLAKLGRVVEINASDPDAGPPALAISEGHVNVTGFSIIGDDISVTTDADLSAYDQCYVTIEYCKVA